MNNQFNNDIYLRPVLRFGDFGDYVFSLQQMLIDLNYLVGMPDGNFGRNTERAVINFQRDFNLSPNGIVGHDTWRALQNVLEQGIQENEPMIKEGDKNVYVKIAQLRLETLGYFFGVSDGIFNADTAEAVKRFQLDNNLIVDGIIGPNTWRALNRSFAATEIVVPTLSEPLKLGDENERVKLLQQSLRALNYFNQEVTGYFDEHTKEAVMRIQTEHNFPATGVVNQATWELIEHLVLIPSESGPDILRLREGMSGDDVIILQEKLQILGLFPGSITGSFGPETTEAVKDFQRKYNLLPTGIVDQNTWEVLYREVNEVVKEEVEFEFEDETRQVLSRPTLRLGDSGEDVKDLQRMLKQLMFYDGAIDGVFGSGTNVAVRAFQTNNKLTADGIVGRNTWSALIYLFSPLAACGSGENGGGGSERFVGVVVDAGHGGTDPGAVSDAIIEKEYTLKISQYMANRFRELGVPFAMTRETDESLTNAERVRRMKAPFGDVKNAIVVSNHINAGGGEGAEVIYALRNTNVLPTNVLNEIGNAGQKMRRVYQRALPNDPTKDYYYIMRDTSNLQVILVEYGFLDNANDVLRLQTNWDKYAEAAVKAVTEYMGYTYTPPVSGKIVHVVAPGDTLWSIASKYGTTVDEIKRLNNLTSNNLTIGQQLIISGTGIEPTPPAGNIVYVVRSGDTLWSIANKFDTTVDEIKRVNGLTTESLEIGQQLLIPGTSVEVPETSPTVHTVASGDTLYSIASHFNTTVASLKRWNKLTSDTIEVGQRLIVAQPTGREYTFHKVSQGDTLWNIANRFDTSVEELKSINNLTSDVLEIGQQLIVPLIPDNYFSHTVVSGDTLWSLANRFNTSVDAIKQLNNLTSNALSIGQIVRIPIS